MTVDDMRDYAIDADNDDTTIAIMPAANVGDADDDDDDNITDMSDDAADTADNEDGADDDTTADVGDIAVANVPAKDGDGTKKDGEPATKKQIALIKDLMSQQGKDITHDIYIGDTKIIDLTKKQASSAIDELLKNQG